MTVLKSMMRLAKMLKNRRNKHLKFIKNYWKSVKNMSHLVPCTKPSKNNNKELPKINILCTMSQTMCNFRLQAVSVISLLMGLTTMNFKEKRCWYWAGIKDLLMPLQLRLHLMCIWTRKLNKLHGNSDLIKSYAQMELLWQQKMLWCRSRSVF